MHESHDHHEHESHDHESHEIEEAHGQSHENENMHGIYLHILADALGSVGVIISSVLVKYYDL